jgi:L-threonylcarbamoyladenylate synthase
MTKGSFSIDIDEAVKHLSFQRGVIAVPTDTVYSVISRCDYFQAVERICNMKERDRSKPLVMLGADPEALFQWVTGDLTYPYLLAKKYWPGPLTIVARASERVSPGVLADGTTLGMRVPQHEGLRKLLTRLPGRCAASAHLRNIGTRLPVDAEDVSRLIGDRVDYIMQDCGQAPCGSPSTIIDVSESEPVVLRDGAIPAKEVLDYLCETIKR